MELSLSADDLKDITLLEETAASELWLARLYSEPVVVKRSKLLMPGVSHADMLRNEYHHLQQFPHAKLITVKGIFTWNDTPVLLREYFEGLPLDLFLAHHSFSEYQFVRLAAALVEAVQSIHESGCIHARLLPEHILLRPDLADFRILGLRELGRSDVGSQRQSDKALLDNPYQAPEQHPRSGAPVDNRSDIYALGALFYLLLTGQAPADRQAAGLTPALQSSRTNLHSLCPGLAPVLIRIVEKMLATDLCRRYQTLAAVAVDLRICVGMLEGQVPLADFAIDQLGDVSRLFSKGELYGREEPMHRLVDLLRQSVGQPMATVLVHGVSGIGKSSLVYAAQQAVADQYSFIQAKFEQYASNGPFQGLFAALQQLLRQLLSEPSEQVRRWGGLFHDALGNEAGILVEALPELALFIGEPPEAVEVPAADSKVRLYRLLSRFVQTLASVDHPLCLFLDDCQWADTATLEWLEAVRHELNSVMVIFAFRDDAESMSAMLSGFLARLNEQRILPLDISLEPLSASLISDLLQHRLKLSSEAAAALAATIVEKTQGNPLYASEYLHQCQLQRVLWFDHADLAWKLDLQKQANIPASENVVQLLAGRLVFLPQDEQTVLKTAACIGNQFGVDMLKRLLPDLAVEPLLANAHADGWLVPRVTTASGEYAFAHDRIQQAAYGLMDKQTALNVHLSIAQCLMDGNQAEAHLMEAVFHYNVALEQITDTQLLIQVGQLNLRATAVAKKNGDFHLALAYIVQAMTLLLPQQTDPQRRAEILKERAECEHLGGRKSAALSYYHQALNTSTDTRQRTRVYELLIKFHTDHGEFQQAYDTGRKALAELDFSLPAGFNPLNFAVDYAHLKRKLRGVTLATLLALPEASDAFVRDQIRLLSAMQKTAYQLRPELCVALAAKQVGLCLRYGNTREAVVGYMVFGVIFLGGIRCLAEEGEKYGRLSLAMLERYSNQMQSAEVPFVYGYFAHSWLHPASDTERLWQRAYERGLEIGDWFHVGCACAAILQSQLMRGQPLEHVLQQCDDFLATLQRIDAQHHVQVLVGIRQAILNLRSPSPTLPLFSHDDFDENAYLKTLSQSGLRHLTHMYFVNKMWVLYFQGYHEEAAAVAVISQGYMKDSQGLLHAVEHCFVHALVLAQLRSAGRLQRHREHLRIKRYARKLHKWAKQCPDNFLARAQLLQGELYRIAGDFEKAIGCYQQACTTAEFYGQLNLQIVGHQLTEQLYAIHAQRLAAQCHQREKKQLAERWGVDSRYTQPGSSHFASQSVHFDLDSLSLAVEVISQERRLPRLLETLMTILQENTLARRCVLMLQDNQQYLIQAESSVEQDEIRVMQSQAYDQTANLPLRVINYVVATREPVLLDDACHYAVFANEPYFRRYHVLSVLCVPLMIQGQVKGIVYLENECAAGVFTQDRFAFLRYLGGQIAISIENALVYQKLEQKVGERTQDIERQKQALQDQNNTISHLNQRLTEENDERKLAEQRLKDANLQLQMLATTDGLTGISNRRHFNEVLKQQYAYCKRHELPFALLICDLDEFKAYNDHYGHQAGDKCLIAVAECLASVIKRPGDLVARYGGEEFAIILSDTHRDGALNIAEQIHQAIEECAIPHEVSSVNARVTLSMGLNVGLDVDTNQLIFGADKALYRAKRLGKNRTCVFTADG